MKKLITAAALVGIFFSLNAPHARAEEEAAPEELPVQTQNIIAQDKAVSERLTKIEKQYNSGHLTQPSVEISSMRSFLHDFYKGLIGGGANTACTGCQNSDEWKAAKAKYPEYSKRLAKLETAEMKCTWGLQFAKEKIVDPSITWTLDEWTTKLDLAKHKAARCWDDKDKSKYVS